MRGAGKIRVLRRYQRRDQLPFPLPEQRCKHQGQQNGGKRQLQIDDAHDQRLDAPADEAGQRPQCRAKGECDRAGHQADLNRDSQAVNDGRKQVPPLCIRAEPVRVAVAPDKAGGTARIGEHELRQIVRILRRDQRRGHRDQDDQREHHDRDHRYAAFAELDQEEFERAVLRWG